MPRLILGSNDYGDLESRSDESNPAKIQVAGETWIGNYTKGYKAGYEAIHMIRKGQVCGSAPAARGGLLRPEIPLSRAEEEKSPARVRKTLGAAFDPSEKLIRSCSLF